MHISFSENGNWKECLFHAYSFRFTETPVFTQLRDCITTAVNPKHREGFDNISLLSNERFGLGVTATLQCAFDDVGCPEIILVENPEQCDDGAVRYGACFEIIPWKNGINVWRHYRDNGQCHWHLRLGMTFPVEEQKLHTLKVQVLDKVLIINLDGFETTLHVNDLPEQFHVGLTGCEGIARIYEMEINTCEGEITPFRDSVPSL
jgi:hypothetical protein